MTDNTADYLTWNGHRGRRRSITIRIDLRTGPDGTTGYEIMVFGDAILGGVASPIARSDLSEKDALAAIDELQIAWRDHVVQRKEIGEEGPWFPFSDEWDLSYDDEKATSRLDAVMPRLAREGHKLFELLFRNGDHELAALTDVLVAALRSEPQVVTVLSNDLFVPWWMLYLPLSDDVDLDDDAAPWEWDGFWGHRHLIEHCPNWASNWQPCLPVDPGSRPITGVNVDETLDEEFPDTPVVAPVVTMFQTRTTSIVRVSKSHLGRDIKSPGHRDQIAYFGCHGDGLTVRGEAQATLRLTDQELIRSNDFTYWLKQKPFKERPLVFINACQGGRMSSMFYTAIGRVLLGGGASCVIGPQIDIPPLFAREYALAFFEALLQGRPAGDVTRELTYSCAERRNPLGLVISMYRGIDTHICVRDTVVEPLQAGFLQAV